MVLESSQRDDSLDTVASSDHEPSAAVHSFAGSKIQEAPEASLQLEIKSNKPRPATGKGNSVRGRLQETKAATKDSKPYDVEIPRKRQREQASRNTDSEHTAGDSDEDVDNITTGAHRKKRPTAIPVSMAPVQNRYHLRRHRYVGKEEDKAQASPGAMEKHVNGDIRTVPSPKDNLTPSQGEKRENGKAETLVEMVTHEEIVKVEAETDFKDKNMGKRPVEDPHVVAGISA